MFHADPIVSGEVVQTDSDGRVSLTWEQYTALKNGGMDFHMRKTSTMTPRFEKQCHDSKFEKRMNYTMGLQQAPGENTCFTCAFVSMLCKLLVEQDIPITAESLLEQMKNANAEWLQGQGRMPSMREVESFMARTRFRDALDKLFKVRLELSFCVSPPWQTGTTQENIQRNFDNTLKEQVRMQQKYLQFLIGFVHTRGATVDSKPTRDVIFLDRTPRNKVHGDRIGGHAVGIYQADQHSARAWNSWGNNFRILDMPLSYVFAFVVVNITQIEIAANPVELLLESQPVMSDWMKLENASTDGVITEFEFLFPRHEIYYSRQGRPEVQMYATHANSEPTKKPDPPKPEKRKRMPLDATSQPASKCSK